MHWANTENVSDFSSFLIISSLDAAVLSYGWSTSTSKDRCIGIQSGLQGFVVLLVVQGTVMILLTFVTGCPVSLFAVVGVMRPSWAFPTSSILPHDLPSLLEIRSLLYRAGSKKML